MVRHLQKLVRNGNSTQITIPATFLAYNRWSSGEWKAIELAADGSVIVRQPTTEDFTRRGLQPPTPKELSEVQP